MNNCTFAGNLGRDAALRTVSTSNGDTSVLNFALAVTKRKKDQNGDKQTLWVDCAMWGNRADALAQYLLKGQKVCVSGEVDVECYESNGQTLPKMTLNVQQVTLMGDRNSGQQQPPNGQQRQSQPQQDQYQQNRTSQPAQNMQQNAPASEPDFDFDDDIPFARIGLQYPSLLNVI